MAKEYILRETALKAIHEEWDEVCNYDGSGHELTNEMESVIDRVPAADVRPVVRGRWREMDKGYYVCSACNTFITVNYGYKYCPNCGAKMDGGQDDA